MGIKRKIKTFINDSFDRFEIKTSLYHEMLKYKDKRRSSIWKNVHLSKTQENEVLTFYKENYGRIPLMWHRHYTAFTGSFDINYIPELLYIPEFERFMNQNKEYAQVLMDKNFLTQFIKSFDMDVTIPKTICSKTAGVLRDEKFKFASEKQISNTLAEVGRVFIKPTKDSCSGRGCFIADFHAGKDNISGKTVLEVINKLGNDFAIQECIKCHSSIAKIYPGSVNTFRVISYRWKNEIVLMPVIMRIGQGGNYLDNAHAGGMFIAVDNDGSLHKTAFTEFKKEYTVHPDTGVHFEGYRIESFEKVLQAAKSVHQAIPQLGCINWDFTIDESGNPVLIEANCLGGSIWLSQMAHGKGPFGDKTAEILRWLRFMKHLSKSKRAEYKFGYM